MSSWPAGWVRPHSRWAAWSTTPPSTRTTGSAWCCSVARRAEPWASAPWDQDPDWEFHTAADLEPAALLDRYAETCERSRANIAAAAAAGGLDHLSAPHPRRDERFNLRWILLHMLEETARHNGHADMLREAIDGETGE